MGQCRLNLEEAGIKNIIYSVADAARVNTKFVEEQQAMTDLIQNWANHAHAKGPTGYRHNSTALEFGETVKHNSNKTTCDLYSMNIGGPTLRRIQQGLEQSRKSASCAGVDEQTLQHIVTYHKDKVWSVGIDETKVRPVSTGEEGESDYGNEYGKFGYQERQAYLKKRLDEVEMIAKAGSNPAVLEQSLQEMEERLQADQKVIRYVLLPIAPTIHPQNGNGARSQLNLSPPPPPRCSEVIERTSKRVEDKQLQKMRECEAAGHTGDWDELLLKKESKAIIRRSLSFITELKVRIEACNGLLLETKSFIQEINALAASMAGAMSIDSQTQAPSSNAPDKRRLDAFTVNIKAYVQRYYDACVRVTAHEALIVMITSLDGRVKYPLARAMVPHDRTVYDIEGFLNHAIGALANAGVNKIMCRVFDQALVKMQQRDPNGKTLNVNEMVKQVKDDAKKVGDAHKTAQVICDKLAKLGMAQGLKPFDIMHDVDGVDGTTPRPGGGHESAEHAKLWSDLREAKSQCTDADELRVLNDLENILIRMTSAGRIQPSSVNLNTAAPGDLECAISGMGPSNSQKLVQWRDARAAEGSPLLGSIEQVVRECPLNSVCSALMKPSNRDRIRFDGDKFKPAAGILKKVRIKSLRATLEHLLFYEMINDLAEKPSCRKTIPDGEGGEEPVGEDFRCEPNSRVRRNFSRPYFNKFTHRPTWNLACWVHVHKRPRCSIARGRLEGATPEQREMYLAYIKIVDKTKGTFLTKAEVDGADEMSVPLARKMFSDWAVMHLREEGELRTADFAEHMRIYFDSCDTRGVALSGRKASWNKVYRWLMDMQDVFETGPYVGVLTRTSWESMLCTLTGFRQICDYLQEHMPATYEEFNIRSINNDPCENFFSLVGYRTAKDFQNKYHAIKVEAEKKFREERGELRYRMSRPRKNTGLAALPFNNPAITGRKRTRGVHGEDGSKREELIKRVKKEYIAKRATGDSRSQPLRALAGCKVDTSRVLPHGVTERVALEQITNQEGAVVFTQLTTEAAQKLKDEGADERTIEMNTPQNTDEWLKFRQHLPGRPGQHPTGGSSLWTRCGGSGLKKMKGRIDYECGRTADCADSEPVSERVQGYFDYGHKHEMDAMATLIKQVSFGHVSIFVSGASPNDF